MTHVCSNCGSACGVDSRMGAYNAYLVCPCADPKYQTWINDGMGGYTVYLNNATPVSPEEYQSRRRR